MHILIVEHDSALAGAIKQSLENHGHGVTVAGTAPAAASLAQAGCDAALLDRDMHGLDAGALLDTLRARQPGCRCLVIRGAGAPADEPEWIRRGVAACLRKPFHPDYPAILLERLNLPAALGLSRDGGELEQARTALSLKETQYKAILQTAMDGFCLVDMQGRILEVNQAYCGILGYSATELLSMRINDVEFMETPTDTAERIARIARTGQDRFTTRQRRKDGGIVDLEVSVQHRPDQGGLMVAFLRDLSVHKQLEAELRRSREQFLLAIRGSQDGIWDWDLVTNTLYLSPRWKEQLGFRDDELPNGFPTFEDRLHPEDKPRVLDLVRRYLQGEDLVYDVEFRMLHRDGSYRWVRARGEALRDAGGRPYRMAGSHTDITERKRHELALRESEERFAQLARLGRTLVWEVDANGLYTYVSDAAKDLLGYPPEEVVGRMHFYDFAPPDAREAVKAQVLVAMSRREVFVNQVVVALSRTGEEFWGETNGIPILNADGSLRGYRGATTDITARRRAEQVACEHSERLNLLSDRIPNGLIYEIVADPAGFFRQFSYLSAGVEKMHGVTVEAAMRDPALIYGQVLEADRARVMEAEATAQRTMTPFSAEVRVCLPSGETRWRLFNSAPRKLADGRIAWDGVEVDITQHRAMEEQVLLAKERAEAASMAKSMFLANMSHELRTPLNPIIGFADILAEAPNLDEEQREFARIIKRRGADLLGLIGNILDLTQIEAGRVVISSAPADLRQLVHEVAATAQIAAAARDLRFACRLGAAAPEEIVTDGLRLKQILSLLLNNAVKFTARGGVDLEVAPDPGAPTQRAPQANEVVLRFSVRDTGIGISPEKLKELFQPFVQVEMSYTRRFGGAGLGLAIARSLVEQMGGCIGVTSIEGQGSTFWFSIVAPVSGAAWTGEGAAGDGAGQPPLNVLVVEDEDSNRRLLELYLHDAGHAVNLAPDGESALQLFAQQPYDLVLLDIQLPGMNGLDVARAVRAHPDPGRRGVPIIAVTAYATKDDRERFLAVGMNEYLAKPVTAAALSAAMAAVLAAMARPEGKAQATAGA